MAGHAVFGIFNTRQNVEDAISALKGADFRGSDISILAPDNLGDFRDMGTVKHTKGPEGVVLGAIIGCIIGGVLGWLAAAGRIPSPEHGYAAAGMAVAILAGLGALGVIGGIIGAIAGAGIPEYEAKRFETRLRKGGILLSVHVDSNQWSTRAKRIFKQAGAHNISSVTEKHAA